MKGGRGNFLLSQEITVWGIIVPRYFMAKAIQVEKSVTDMALNIIDSVIKKESLTNRFDIVEAVCNDLESRYGDNLEAGCEKLKLQTTKDILHAIDIYFVMKQLYPETSFKIKQRRSRKSVQSFGK